MAWLRIDDGFTSNGKIAQLTDGEFRVWVRLLCHCARSRDPSVDSVARREVNGLSRARVARFAALELLDGKPESYEVHDWPKYLPKEQQNADRQARWRARRRNAQVDEQSNASVDEEGDSEITPSRAGTRGVPSRPVPLETSKPLRGRPRDELWDALKEVLGTEPATKSERGRWNKAVGELREIGATADDIRLRSKAYRKRWPETTLTPTALTANWGTLNSKATAVRPCEQCGVGGGQHAADCVVVAPFTDADIKKVATQVAAHSQ